MATVQFIACRPLPVPVPTRHPSSQLAETETEMPFRSFQQHSPAAASATAFAESKAALRRRARVRRQALMVVAGRRLPGEQRPAGVHPAGHRSLLVVVVPLIATARGSRSESCLRMDRSLVHAVDRRTDSPRWCGSAAAERDAPSSVHRVAERQAI
jgi:hypothetical protein